MATIAQLETAYTAITRQTPNAAQSLILQDLAARSQTGVITDAQAYQYIIGQATGTTSVAGLTYQFFTGKTPSSAGFDYLVNSSTNTSDLNDAYYQTFNTENRYINFAINLGVVGEGRTNFVATFGGLSFADTVAVAYNRIVGNAQAQAAGIDPAAAIANITGRKAYFDAVVAQAGITAADRDLAAKAAVVGYILAEATKAQVGVYSNALNNFYLDLAPDAKATYNTDLVATYANNDGGDGGPGIPGSFIDLSAGPAALSNQVVSTTAANPALRSSDNNDTLSGKIGNLSTTDATTISLGNGADTVLADVTGGATKATTIDLGAGNDTFKGAVTGGASTVTILGGEGNDTVTVTTYAEGAGKTTFNGGTGTDTLNLTFATDIGATTVVTAFETINLTNTDAAVKTVDASLITAGTGSTTALWATSGKLAVTDVAEGITVGSSSAAISSFAFDNADNATLAVKGAVGAVTITGVDETLTISAATNSTVAVTTSTEAVSFAATAAELATTVTFSGVDADDALSISAAGSTKNVSVTTTTNANLTVADGGSTSVTLGAGNDLLNLSFGGKAATTVNLGAGNDTVVLGTGTQNFAFDTGALKTVATIADFVKGGDKIDVAGTYLAAAPVIAPATFEARVTAYSAQLGAGQWTVFEVGSDSYILHGGATAAITDDTLVKLTGVTGLTIGTTSTADVY